MSEYEFTDRYQALGIPYPNPETVCQGQCEGTGCYPEDDITTPEWQEQHMRNHTWKYTISTMWRHKEWWYWKFLLKDALNNFPCDGWHFVVCQDCKGTGKRLAS